jgi:L-cysteate sulfo-lyase
VSVSETVPSVDLGVWRTPVERAPRLAARIGLRPDDLWVKRDDWLGLGGGGNKLRKLEFLCAHALEELGATVLVTGGASQSNYCRLTAASARRLGLGVVLVLAGDGAAGASGNLTLDGLFQADVRWAGEVTADALDDMVATVADELRSRAERPAVLPFGGSNALAARGISRARRSSRSRRPVPSMSWWRLVPGRRWPGLWRAWGRNAYWG